MVCVWPANLSEEPVTTFVESTVVTVDLAHQEKQLMTTNVEKIVACTHSNYSTCTHVPENTRENTRGPRENGNETGNGTQYTDSVYCMSHPATQPLVFPILLDPLYIPTVHFECGLSECRAYLAKDGDEGSRGWGINIYTMNQELDDRLSNGHLPESLLHLSGLAISPSTIHLLTVKQVCSHCEQTLNFYITVFILYSKVLWLE